LDPDTDSPGAVALGEYFFGALKTDKVIPSRYRTYLKMPDPDSNPDPDPNPDPKLRPKPDPKK
jgi:hypothetical protein